MGAALTATVLVATAGASTSSSAQDAAETALARRLFNEGMQAAERNEWERARDAFRRSYELVGRTRILANLATAQAHTGQLVEAAENYRRFLRETGDSEASARDRVGRELAELERRIPQIRIEAPGLAAGDRISLDDGEVSRAAVGVDMPVNPGEHRVVVRRGDSVVASRSFRIAEGAKHRLHLTVPTRTETANDREAERAEVLTGSAKADAEGGSVASSPWLWTGVAAVVLGGVLAAVLLTRDDAPAREEGNIGPGRIIVR